MKTKHKVFFDLLDKYSIDYVIKGESIIVKKDLDFDGYREIRETQVSVPDNLIVAGNFSLFFCSYLTSLPSNLIVAGDLDLRNCTGIREIPSDIVVTGTVYLNGCKLYPFDINALRIVGWVEGKYETVPNSVRFISDEK